jgi:molybdate transport system regulatory protein
MIQSQTMQNRPMSVLQPFVEIWFEMDGRYAFGHDLCQILQAIEHSGSIKHAAATLGKSYRHVWGRVQVAQRTLGQQLVEARVGGKGVQRSALTLEARRLISDFLSLREKMMQLLQDQFAQRFG